MLILTNVCLFSKNMFTLPQNSIFSQNSVNSCFLWPNIYKHTYKPNILSRGGFKKTEKFGKKST